MFTIVLACGSLTAAYAGNKLPVTFTLMNGLQPLQLTSGRSSPLSDTPQIRTFRFYISEIALYQDDKLQWKEPGAWLVDAAIPASSRLLVSIPEQLQYNTIKFYLGIDSITNVSGVMGGDLDPAKGMYWAWQSGYINFKLEGFSPACPTRDNEFQFHLGGYAAPFATLQPVQLKTAGKGSINIVADVAQFLAGLDLATQNSIMIPGTGAVTLARKAASIFSISK